MQKNMEEEERVKNVKRRESNASLTPCPFALALEDDEEGSHQNSPHSPQQQAKEVLQIARKSCPAFSSNECPFSKARSPEELREKLQQIPSSHSNMIFFQKALVLFQQHSSSISSPSFDLSLVEVLEEFSSANIMSQMARKIQQEEQKIDDSIPQKNQPKKSEIFQGKTDDETVSKERSSRRLSLSEAFKKGTAEAHEAAENVHFVKNFIAGDIDRNLYADLIRSLYSIYQTMEELLDEFAPISFPTCHFPKELARTAALEEDMDFWHGSSPSKEEMMMSPATQDYVQHLKEITKKGDPLMLLAHAYTRYLGDLSGGKILARVARRAMKLDKSGDGLAFYQFENIKSEKTFKDMYRQQLDQLKLEPSRVQALVQEANVAFLLNMRIFEELDVKAKIPGATVRPLSDVWSFHSTTEKKNDHGAGGNPEECPFLAKKKKKEVASSTEKEGRCPWPFVFFHDPMTGLRDYQTWIVIGLIFSWIWSSSVQ